MLLLLLLKMIIIASILGPRRPAGGCLHTATQRAFPTIHHKEAAAIATAECPSDPCSSLPPAMPLVLPSVSTAGVSDASLREMEPSTVLVEMKRVGNSIAKLKESNQSLAEAISTDSTAEDKKMYEGVIQENDQVMFVSYSRHVRATSSCVLCAYHLNPACGTALVRLHFSIDLRRFLTQKEEHN